MCICDKNSRSQIFNFNSVVNFALKMGVTLVAWISVSGHMNMSRMASMYACLDTHLLGYFWTGKNVILQEGVHVVGGPTQSLSDQLETIEA